MDKLKEKLSRLMYGRYGIDQLGNFMMWAAVAMYLFFDWRIPSMKRLKQIGALLAIAVLIGFGLGADLFESFHKNLRSFTENKI